MAPVFRNKGNKKKHHSERFVAPGLWVERYSNAKCGFIGFYLGQAKTYVEVAEIIGDGTSSDTLRRMVALWKLPVDRARRGFIVNMTTHKKRKLAAKCEQLGIEPEEYLRRIAEAVIGDDLYDAVTDGKFDNKGSTR
jgi:hypothetical protein